MQQRRGAVATERVGAVDQGHRHAFAVPGRRPQVLGRVARRVEVAEHRFALEQRALAGPHVVVVGGVRRGERGVRVADDVAVDLLVGAERRTVRRLVRLDVEPALAGPRQDADLAQPVHALLERQEAAEDVGRGDVDVVAVRHDLAPVLDARRRVDRDLHDAEVARLPVGADDPAPVDVVGRILVTPLAWQQHAKAQFGVVRACVAHFGRDRAARVQQDVLAVLRQLDRGVEGLVLLLVDQRVAGGVRAEHVHAHAQAEQRDGVLLDVEHATVVRRPGHGLLDVRHGVDERLAGLERLEPQRVLASPDRVFGVGEQTVVLTRLERADVVVVEPLRLLAQVDQDLFRRLGVARPARKDRILVAGFESAVVPEVVVAVRDAGVVLLDAPDDLAVELVLQRPHRGRHRIAISVFGPQVREHLGRGARVVAQPVVVVLPRAVRRLDRVRTDRGDRRLRACLHGAAAGPRCGQAAAGPMRTVCVGRVPPAW